MLGESTSGLDRAYCTCLNALRCLKFVEGHTYTAAVGIVDMPFIRKGKYSHAIKAGINI